MTYEAATAGLAGVPLVVLGALGVPEVVVVAVIVVQGLQPDVVDLVAVGKGSSIPVVCSILPKLVCNLAVLLC